MSDSLNIAVVGACPYPVPQGSQVYLRNTALALRAAGHTVHLVTYGYGLGEDTSGLPLHRAKNLPLAHQTAAGPSLAKPLQDALLVRKLREVVRTQRIDVINAHNYEGLMVALAARVRPIVYHPHNALMDELPHYVPAPAQRLVEAIGRVMDKTLPRRADLIIAPHEELAGYLIAMGCAPDRVKIVPPPIDMDAAAPAYSSRGTPPLLYAGNLDRYQNVDTLRTVMARVRAEIPTAELILATASPCARDLLAVSEFARVVRTHSMAAVLHDLPDGAVFVCPRLSWSGYPIKLLNAMAAGLPIVCFEATAYPVIQEETGLAVRDNDVAGFAAAAVRLLRDSTLRANMGAAARQRAKQEYSISAAAARLDPLFRDLGKRPR